MEENKIKPPKLPNQKAVKKKNPKPQPVVDKKEFASQTIQEKNPVLVTHSNRKKIIVLVALFLVAIILATTLFAVVLPKSYTPLDIDVQFEVDANINIGADYETGNKKLMPGDTFDGTYSVKIVSEDDNSNAEVFVRVAIFAKIDGKAQTNIFQLNPSEQDWILGADGFYYMYGTLKANELVTVVSDIVLNKDLDNSYQGKNVSLIFVGECLQAGEMGSSAIEAIWKEAPSQWKQSQRENKG